MWGFTPFVLVCFLRMTLVLIVLGLTLDFSLEVSVCFGNTCVAVGAPDAKLRRYCIEVVRPASVEPTPGPQTTKPQSVFLLV